MTAPGTTDRARELAMRLRRGDPLPAHLRVWAHRQLGGKLEEMVSRGDVVGLCKVFGANPRDYIGRPNALRAMCKRGGVSGELPARCSPRPKPVLRPVKSAT